MNKIKRIIAIGCLSVMAFGCKEDFLELAPISNSNANNFYKTREDFDLASNAAYATLYTVYAPESSVSYTEQLSDNATLYNVAGIQADRWAFKDYSLRTSNVEVYRFWQENYRALFSINIVLDKIETASVDEAYKEQVKAQMRFLRGLYYFNMVQLWGDLPLVTKPLSAEESYKVLRSPVADVYKLITEDLEYAAEKLPLASAITAPGKASKGAAQTLLGKVYLTQKNKTAAAQILQEVVNSKQYELLPSYASLWVVTNKNTKESIFEIQYKGGAGNPYSNYWTAFAPTENFVLTQFGGGMNQVTDDLYNEYEPGDPRRDASISTGYTNKVGTFIPIKFPIKWMDRTAQVVGGRELSNNNFMVLRYADVLLMLAEATGDANFLNQVRTRAGLPAFGAAGYPTDKYPTLELAIEHERRVELALEFHRWFDLKRTDRALPVLTAKGKAVTPQKLLIPIPEIVRQQNPAIAQNEGY
ncbi:RagB/SusD family nutrient uptake outer membrane protein [Adhaeribacter rhizoryzae]|uniref:RagB/SusD family nutrient uptake outer membrane protein n=1 Tax=Adhaeribacter rhizoryzae TaxID=2607907 RepID=A0A5M6D093_9BACT|nr:RagB/SusD family nutrient uptake outer membrane protein [Adhaeribacter rhizoryzae]KAA5540874.1 RagB/SusD family nutrient uptake outer membrane protein [Adhaeribacter rhizoryzae]